MMQRKAGDRPPGSPATSLRSLLAALLVASSLAAAPAVAEVASGSLAGVWQGEILYQPGSRETEIAIELRREESGAWAGWISVPWERTFGRALREVVVAGREVRFAYDAEEAFSGELTAGCDCIVGQVSGHSGRHPFVLSRTAGPLVGRGSLPPLAPLQDLGPAAEELAESLEDDLEKPRLILLLSPACRACVLTARAVARHVLAPWPGADLRVDVVWVAALPEDGRRRAAAMTNVLADERVRHFWAASLAQSDPVLGQLRFAGVPSWDVVLFLRPGRHALAATGLDGRSTWSWPDGYWFPSEEPTRPDEASPGEHGFDARAIGRRLARELTWTPPHS